MDIKLYIDDSLESKNLKKKLDDAKLNYELVEDIPEFVQNLKIGLPILQVKGDYFDYMKGESWLKHYLKRLDNE